MLRDDSAEIDYKGFFSSPENKTIQKIIGNQKFLLLILDEIIIYLVSIFKEDFTCFAMMFNEIFITSNVSICPIASGVSVTTFSYSNLFYIREVINVL